MTDLHTPIISVVMAVYNGDAYLGQAIESILRQSFTDFELIVIDDGSTDSTPEILADFAKADQRIRLTRLEHRGLTQCLNEGIRLARGQLVARMDADDVSLPERFATQMAFLEPHPEVGLLGTDAELISAEGKHFRHVNLLANTDGALRWHNFFTNPFLHSSVIMHRAALEAVGGYDASFVVSQDRDLWDRLLAVTKVANLPDFLLQLRLHSTNVSHTRRKEQLDYGAKVGHRAMSACLGAPQDFELCRVLQSEEFISPEQVVAAAALLTQLYRAFIQKERLLPAEARFVRDDYAHLLFRMARKWPTDPRMLKLMVHAVATSPVLVFHWLYKQSRQSNP